MEPLKLKKGSIVVYLVLLALVLIVMIIARNNALKGSAENKSEDKDTINVAIQISPIGVTTISDTLGGIYYDKIRQIAVKQHFYPKISGITNIQSAITDLKNGVFDVIIADTTNVILSSEDIKIQIATPLPDSLQSQFNAWAIISRSSQILNRIESYGK